jgi:hypothetical protein
MIKIDRELVSWTCTSKMVQYNSELRWKNLKEKKNKTSKKEEKECPYPMAKKKKKKKKKENLSKTFYITCRSLDVLAV